MEAWRLEKAANCNQCGESPIHDIVIDRYKMSIICRDCGFIRYYTFHVVDIPKD